MSEINQKMAEPDDTSRWVLAFFVSPLVVGFLEQFLIAFYERPALPDIGFEIVFVLAASIIGGYPIYIVFGLPTILMCRKFGFVQLKEFALAGAIAGVVSMMTIHFAFTGSLTATLRYQILAFISFAFAGAISASVTWLIARPDKHAERSIPRTL